MPSPPDAPPTDAVYTVSQLNREVADLFAERFGPLWVQGELSNLARPASGHWYFTLKDDQAQVRAAMFRHRNRLVAFTPEAGQQVLVRARPSLYEPRGDYQLVVEHMEPLGEGALRLAFEALKRKLQAEGLFDAARKRPLPAFPRRIGVITSPSGAALRDVLQVLRRRCPAVEVLIYPTGVQGAGAVESLIAALETAGARRDCDVLLLVRGGGDLEDLQAFNDERLARAIAACPVPVVSGVGHEIDFTIADFVADLRAPTPSAAAELASPDAAAWLKRLATDRARLLRRLRERLARAALRLAAAQRALRRLDPRRRLLQDSQRLDELHGRMQRAMRRHLRQAGRRLEAARARLTPDRLAARLAAARRALPALRRGLLRHARRRLETARGRFEQTLHTLDAVGPLATLRRGYAAVFVAGRRAALREAAQAPPGTPLAIVLARGELEATVTAQHPHNRLERHAPEK